MSDGTPDHVTDRPPRRGRRIAIVAAAVVAVAVVATIVVVVRTTGTTQADPVPATVPVAISAKHVPDHTSLGVVLTLGTGEGSEWNGAAQGARVAQHRLQLGGTDVSLITEDDGGTDLGARNAVHALARKGVSGIVLATSGPHVGAAVHAAAAAGIPTILPYSTATGADAWSLAPSATKTGTSLTDALGSASATLLVDLGGGRPAAVQVDHVITAGDQTDAALATRVAQMTDTSATAATTESTAAVGSADAVLVSGPADREGSFLAAVQADNVTVPVVLTGDATSPAFAAALQKADGSLSGEFRTVGAETDDAVALRSDASGRAMSAFLGGVRVIAGDSGAKNLTGDQSFSAVAADADARSHDAVIALTRAVAAAGSRKPAAVAHALHGLTLGTADGIAGPALDFATHRALTGDVRVLSASSQSLGLRPASTSADDQLVWFSGPSGK